MNSKLLASMPTATLGRLNKLNTLNALLMPGACAAAGIEVEFSTARPT
ncbi:hypothetical protein BOTU111921_18235 [Bordetella tumbae]